MTPALRGVFFAIIKVVKASLVLCILAVAGAQDVADPYSTGATLVSFRGCPVFVLGVVSGSPAERAGLRSGDRIMSVNGAHPADLTQAADLLRSDTPGPVSITVLRGDQEINALSQRERRSVIFAKVGKKLAKGGMIVPQDMTQAEVDRISALDFSRQVGQVFLPTHYPANPDLFYPGFEMFLLRDPAQLMVAGIEDGPGARAGVHYGDVVNSVNGISVAGKTPAELEALFSSSTPSIMRLQIDRLGTVRVFEFPLAKASEIARQNGRRLLAGNHIAPLGVTDRDLHCFVQQATPNR
jgi:C-terminal processing protease CtpA/Prc